jgi:hypothetical protein
VKQYQDRTAGQVIVTFRDAAKALANPVTASYRIDCVTTGLTVHATTSLTAASQITIDLTSDDNAIISSSNQAELKKITVNATFSVSDEIHEEAHYLVRNMRYVP